MTGIKKAEKGNKITKSDLPNELRRTLLKTSWVVPVITVVGLPAHAQTSCPQLIAPSETAICDDPQTVDSVYYVIDDETNTCPELVIGQEGSPFSFRIDYGLIGNINSYGIRVTNGTNNRSLSQLCENPVFPDTTNTGTLLLKLHPGLTGPRPLPWKETLPPSSVI